MNENTNESNEKIVNKPKRKYIIILILLVLLLIIIIALFAYAFFSPEAFGESRTDIDVSTDCVKIEFKNDKNRESIELGYDYPVTDEWATGTTNSEDNITPIEVKVINKCTNDETDATSNEKSINYTLAITTLLNEPTENDKGNIPDNKVRYKLKKANSTDEFSDVSGPEYLSNLKKITEDNPNYKLIDDELTKKAIQKETYNTVNYYVLDSSSVKTGTTNTYKLYLWIDYYEGDTNAYQGQQHNSQDFDKTTEGQKLKSLITLLVNTTNNKESSN